MHHYDYLIVGAGLAGSVMAQSLRSAGADVLVIDRRDHIGGNCYDFYNRAGVLVHKYGPHYFRTNSDAVISYLSQFTLWRLCEYRIRASLHGRLYTFPINRDTLNQFFRINLQTDKEARMFLNSKRERHIRTPKNAEEQVLALAGREIYEAFFKNYTRKQWGVDPRALDASVTARIPIRTNTDDRYVDERFQAMPRRGYTALFRNLLKKVPVLLNRDFERVQHSVDYQTLIYTGPIDEFFHYRYGKLPYRSLQFRLETYKKAFYQGWSQVNYPNEHRYTRIVEIKHVTGQRIPRTTIVREYPSAGPERFYPIPRRENRERYLKYKRMASRLRNVYFIGRLAQYEYLNMDQCVERCLHLFHDLIQSSDHRSR